MEGGRWMDGWTSGWLWCIASIASHPSPHSVPSPRLQCTSKYRLLRTSSAQAAKQPSNQAATKSCGLLCVWRTEKLERGRTCLEADTRPTGPEELEAQPWMDGRSRRSPPAFFKRPALLGWTLLASSPGPCPACPVLPALSCPALARAPCPSVLGQVGTCQRCPSRFPGVQGSQAARVWSGQEQEGREGEEEGGKKARAGQEPHGGK